MQKTLVAVFDEQSEARQALDALSLGGFPSSKARITSSDSTAGGAASSRPEHDESLGEKVAQFFGFGGQHESTYSEAVRRGSCVLVVDAADDDEAERASDIIERYHPVDIDERQAQWRQSGWQPSQAAHGDSSIPVVEEQLQVGKREVQRGGIRVVSRAIERPVEETVKLREERATVQRRPADRAATESDNAFKEQSFEIRNTAEEAVVGKAARVVEDVVVGKESSEREQTVKDSVRKTEVEVQQLGQGSGSRQDRTPKPGRYGGQERRKSNGSYSGMERRGS
jgi:uncharacterized protein (TIGR02271 family)